jgi:hypothetical protein
MAAGYIVTVANQSAVACVVDRITASNTINGVTSSVPIASLESITFIINSALNGYIAKSRTGLPLSGGTVTGSLTAASVLLTGITLATEQASTSGTSIDFTGIPAGVKRITIMLNGVSTNGTSNLIAQIGDSGGIEPSGYLSSAAFLGNGIAIVATNSTTSFILTIAPAAATLTNGVLVINLQNASTNTFAASGTIGYSSGAAVSLCAGSKALSGTLDRVRITTANGTDAFDAGTINISYE